MTSLHCRPKHAIKYSLKFNGRLGRKLLEGELASLQPYSQVCLLMKEGTTPVLPLYDILAYTLACLQQVHLWLYIQQAESHQSSLKE